MSYAVVRKETRGENLTGSRPYVLAATVKGYGMDAALVERRTDAKVFLLIGATTDETLARAWADRNFVTAVAQR